MATVTSFIKLVCVVSVSIIAMLTLLNYMADYSPNRYNRFKLLDEMKATHKNCTTKSNIFFVKTHKTGSSTVQNVLMRFGASRDLDFAIPYFGNHHVNSYSTGIEPKKISLRALLPPGGNHDGYNVSCFHGIFDESLAAKMVPAEDTVYVTIIRDPVDAFESLYSFMKFDSKYDMDIEEFAYADKTTLPDDFFLERTTNYMGVNQMLYDLGMDPYLLHDEGAVDERVNFLQKHFHLVMIQERFDESMILLRDLMCWDTDDIIYLKHNARDDQHRPRRLSSGAAARIRAMNPGDHKLYEHFRQLFESTIASYGRKRMAREVQLFRKRLDDIHHACVQVTVPSSSSTILSKRFRPWSDMVSGFLLRPEAEGNSTCEELAMPELSFTSLLRRKQLARAVLRKLKVSNLSGLTNDLNQPGDQHPSQTP